MAKAVWNGTVLAESDTYEVVEGNIYFPPESINKEYFKESAAHSTCPWTLMFSIRPMRQGYPTMNQAD